MWAPAGDYATVAGLVLDALGRIPEPGEHVVIGGWRFEVVDASERAIDTVRLSPLHADQAGPDSDRA